MTPRGVFGWVGHHQLPALALIGSTAAATSVTGAEWDDWAPVAACWVWLAGVVAHQARMCVRCASAVPADGQARAVAWRRWLRGWHAMVARPVTTGVGYLALVAVVVALSTPPLGVVAVVYGAPAVWGLAARRHGLVRPWCPQCRDGGGGWGHVPVGPPPGDRIPA